MYWKLFVTLLPHLLVCNSLAKPVIYEAVEDDVVAVGSLIREIRQPAPLRVLTEVEDLKSASNAPQSQDNKKRMKNASGKSDEGGYYRSYGSDAEGEKGYLKETYGKGDQGYKTLDTFHKQDGDKYEFQTQTTYGKDFDNNKKEQKKEEKNSDHEGAGTMVDADYAADEGDHSEYSHYTGSDDGDHYSEHYSEKEPESSYSRGEKYSSGSDDDGSYETHSSYGSDGDGEKDGDHY